MKPSHQRCGIGRALARRGSRSRRSTAGITTITLELRANNYGARAFYRLLGFQEGAYIPGYYRGVETALRMSRDIRRHIPAAQRPATGDASDALAAARKETKVCVRSPRSFGDLPKRSCAVATLLQHERLVFQLRTAAARATASRPARTISSETA